LIGTLHERIAIDLDDAFALLRQSARSEHLNIHDLAAEVVTSRENPPAIIRGLARESRWRAAEMRERSEATRDRAQAQKRTAKEQQT
jgi:hypothetical protein